ncbi:MAG: hypothetical protein E6Q78_11505 [Rhodoferax sp.]|nr:MAG: hypothetical protein E6Q78_11505 [Rhodoferax sp.]
MNRAQRHFFKGLPSFVAPNDDMEIAEARESIYYWWWAFARLSPVLWYANQTGLKPIDPAIAKVTEALGDLWRYPAFGVWWKTRGSKVFAESKRPAKVQQLDLSLLHEHPFDKDKMYVEVPLNIRQQTIVSQFKKLLAQEHEGRALNLAAHSTAHLALHTKRYRLSTIEKEYWVLLYRLLYPNIEIWRIGDRLQVAPHLKVRDTAGAEALKRKHALNAVTGRYYYKARFTLLNLERDSFPNFSEIHVSSRKQPFGSEHQKAFRAATEDGIDGKTSAWAQWLKDTYLEELHREVKRRVPHLEYNMRRPESNARHRIPAFVAGTSDLLE